jgi:23S rRNA (cytidine2498-2'-O)-methyltransferase
VNNEQLLILTAQPEFITAALAELKQFDRRLTGIEELAPGVLLCGGPEIVHVVEKARLKRPIFVRHLAPVQQRVDLANQPEDMGTIAEAMAALPTFAMLEQGIRFAVQSRFVQTDKSLGERPFSSGKLNQALAEAIAEETGAIEMVKKPQIIISILCTMFKAYIGISPAEENISSWPGGTRHYAQTSEQISRAEFKLLEALETFGIALPETGKALDLGAAPGGWTRLLLEGTELQVAAVDPANLDKRLARESRLVHYRGYAEDYLADALKNHMRFDIIVNDMRMDARDAARLLAQAAACLRGDGVVVSVFKLPHTTNEINPLNTLKEALRILERNYAIVQAHQLFHNRQEVTVVAAQPHAERR